MDYAHRQRLRCLAHLHQWSRIVELCVEQCDNDDVNCLWQNQLRVMSEVCELCSAQLQDDYLPAFLRAVISVDWQQEPGKVLLPMVRWSSDPDKVHLLEASHALEVALAHLATGYVERVEHFAKAARSAFVDVCDAISN